LNDRLWRILSSRPDLFPSIVRYFQKYDQLPRRAAKKLVEMVRGPQLYHSVTAALVQTACGRLRPTEAANLDKIIKKQWKPANMRADLVAAFGKWLVGRDLLTSRQLEYATRATKDWWGRAELVRLLPGPILPAALATVLNERLRDGTAYVGVSAAARMAECGVAVARPLAGIGRSAGHTLRQLGLLGRLPAARCEIENSMVRLLGNAVQGIDWKAIFESDHHEVERIAVWCRAYAQTDVTAFVNMLDVFDDWLLFKLCVHDPSLGIYHLGNVGGFVSSRRLAAGYPRFAALLKGIHEKRLESVLSHPRVKSTGRPTGPIKYSYLKTARRLMIAAFNEVWLAW
jgi:hypothetical protein